MGNYELNRLNNNEFEHLVQALTTKIFQYEGIVFGTGRDGAREATFEGTCALPDEEKITGYFVVQAKFKDCTTLHDKQDWIWAKNQFIKEMEKFQDIKRDLRTPNIYLFFTNIQFTAVSKSGGRDQIEEFVKTYNSLIPTIKIYGYDEINKMLDNNRDVATSYASFILSGDILQSLYESIHIKDNQDKNILYRFLNKDFDEDLFSKLEERTEGILIIFGSYASFGANEKSDLDVLSIGKIKNVEDLEDIYNIKINIIKINENKFDKNEHIVKEIIKNHIILKGTENFIYLIWQV